MHLKTFTVLALLFGSVTPTPLPQPLPALQGPADVQSAALELSVLDKRTDAFTAVYRAIALVKMCKDESDKQTAKVAANRGKALEEKYKRMEEDVKVIEKIVENDAAKAQTVLGPLYAQSQQIRVHFEQLSNSKFDNAGSNSRIAQDSAKCRDKTDGLFLAIQQTRNKLESQKATAPAAAAPPPPPQGGKGKKTPPPVPPKPDALKDKKTPPPVPPKPDALKGSKPKPAAPPKPAVPPKPDALKGNKVKPPVPPKPAALKAPAKGKGGKA